jgi:hypothetical protein
VKGLCNLTSFWTKVQLLRAHTTFILRVLRINTAYLRSVPTIHHHGRDWMATLADAGIGLGRRSAERVLAMSAIGPKRTFLAAPHMSAFGGKADMTVCGESAFAVAIGGKADMPFCTAYVR